MHTPWLGALVVLGALGLTVLSGRLDARDGVDARADGISVAAH
jgi:DHA1 family inner membrane transport protein